MKIFCRYFITNFGTGEKWYGLIGISSLTTTQVYDLAHNIATKGSTTVGLCPRLHQIRLGSPGSYKAQRVGCALARCQGPTPYHTAPW